MDSSPAVEASVNMSAARLEREFDRIERCAVVIEVPHRHHHRGRTFHVRIEVTIPNHTIVVSRDAVEDHRHEDVHVAIADAFVAARRQLHDHARIRRGEVKIHA